MSATTYAQRWLAQLTLAFLLPLLVYLFTFPCVLLHLDGGVRIHVCQRDTRPGGRFKEGSFCSMKTKPETISYRGRAAPVEPKCFRFISWININSLIMSQWRVFAETKWRDAGKRGGGGERGPKKELSGVREKKSTNRGNPPGGRRRVAAAAVRQPGE